MKQFTITANDSAQRLDKFVSKVCPTLPKSLLYKSIRTKNVQLFGGYPYLSVFFAVKEGHTPANFR